MVVQVPQGLKRSHIMAPLAVLLVLAAPFSGGVEALPEEDPEALTAVHVRPPTEGTRILLDASTAGPVYRMWSYGAFPAGSLRTHATIFLDSWDGREDMMPSHALSATTGLLFASGASGDGTVCVLGCGPSLQKTLFRTDVGHDRLSAVPTHLLPDLPESALWGHTLQAGERWDLPERFRGFRSYIGNVTVDALTADTVEVTVRTATRDIGTTPLYNTYEAHLTFAVEDGNVGPFATSRNIDDEGTTWSSVVAVIEEGQGAPLPFAAQTEEDIWPQKDLAMRHGPNSPMPYDPEPHPFFDIGLTATVVLAYPDPAVTAFRVGGGLAGVSYATLDILGESDIGWPAHDLLFAGIWGISLCNTAGESLYVVMHGVQVRSAPFIPLTFFPQGSGTCYPEDLPTEHAAVGDVIRATEALVRDRLWQPASFHYTSEGRSDLALTYDHPRLADDKRIEVRLETPYIDHAVIPREIDSTRILP